MCGIIGGVADHEIAATLLDGLKRLEYRGYDSAGLAVLNHHKIHRLRVCGKVRLLKDALLKSSCHGNVGIAHTRWATHGKPSEVNAHPIMSEDILAIVHNGIIENHLELKDSLIARGITFTSDTDTEVIAHLLRLELANGHDLLKASQFVSRKLKGAYALAVLSKDEQDRIIAIRQGSPLVIGLGRNQHFIASDILALLPVTQSFVILDEGDVAEIYQDHYQVYDKDKNPVKRSLKQVQINVESSEKGSFRHYMQKEIFEQPQALSDTLGSQIADDPLSGHFGEQAQSIFSKVNQVHIVACGTSYHAGLVAQHWIQNMLGLPCRVDIASEMRYQRQTTPPNTLFLTLSQSGETADTLAALRVIKENPNYLASMCICNVPESALVRESDITFLTKAGPEIGVASTKAFLTQLAALLLFTLKLAKQKALLEQVNHEVLSFLPELPSVIEHVLELDQKIEEVAELFADKKHALFLGRGILYPIAKEGALKLKEISYIHAESYPAGELKHGPLALVDKDMPVVVLACHDHLLDKLQSNLQEVQARHGQLIVFASKDAKIEPSQTTTLIELPQIPPLLAPMIMAIPMQLLAYHVAVIKGTDVDQPRNLAKSVTVE